MLNFILLTIILLWLSAIFSTAILVIFSFVYLYIELAITNKSNKNKLEFPQNVWLSKCAKECLYVCAKFITFPGRFWPLRYYGSGQNPENLGIMLVHGYSRSQTDWLVFAKKLSHHTTLPITAINLNKSFAPIQVLADQLGKKLTTAAIDLKVNRWLIVGHSMGGLVASYLAEFGDQDNIAAVITLGSPLKGTKLAYAGIGENTRQMEPKNAFLENLNQAITKSQVKYFNIASKLDNMIIPWQSCIISAAVDKFIYDDICHQTLLYNDEIIAKVANWINSLKT